MLETLELRLLFMQFSKMMLEYFKMHMLHKLEYDILSLGLNGKSETNRNMPKGNFCSVMDGYQRSLTLLTG